MTAINIYHLYTFLAVTITDWQIHALDIRRFSLKLNFNHVIFNFNGELFIYYRRININIF